MDSWLRHQGFLIVLLIKGPSILLLSYLFDGIKENEVNFNDEGGGYSVLLEF